MRERSNFTKLATVATDAQRAGNFSGLGVTLYDPATGNPDGTGRTPFPNNIIPGQPPESDYSADAGPHS